MTAAEWQCCTDPALMLEALQASGKASLRKVRLFAVACCRRISDLMGDDDIATVGVAERYADGAAAEIELAAARDLSAENAWASGFGSAAWLGRSSSAAEACAQSSADLWPATLALTRYASGARSCYAAALEAMTGDYLAWKLKVQAVEWEEGKWQCVLLREVFGRLLFLPNALGLFSKSTGSSFPQIAQAIYLWQHLESMPILADALEDAGCEDQEVLAHCREPMHVRGCWVLDLLTGRK